VIARGWPKLPAIKTFFAAAVRCRQRRPLKRVEMSDRLAEEEKEDSIHQGGQMLKFNAYVQ
jgi:hypothetical protein